MIPVGYIQQTLFSNKQMPRLVKHIIYAFFESGSSKDFLIINP